MNYFWPIVDTGNDLKSQRIREIESRMDDFLREKQGIAEAQTIRSVETARKTVRQLSSPT